MTLYYRKTDPSDLRDLGSAYQAWVEAGNPKADEWQEAPPKPAADAIWADGSWLLPSSVPSPDWLSFKTAMLSSADVNAAMGAAMPSAPLAVMSLPAALNAAVAGDTSDFAVTWTTLRQAGLIPQLVLDAVAATAVACHLPAEFVQVLGGEP